MSTSTRRPMRIFELYSISQLSDRTGYSEGYLIKIKTSGYARPGFQRRAASALCPRSRKVDEYMEYLFSVEGDGSD